MPKQQSHSMDVTHHLLRAHNCNRFYLLDANIFDIFDIIFVNTGVDMLQELNQPPTCTFLITNGVGSEVMNGPIQIPLEVLFKHMISIEGGGSESENRFIKKENGIATVAYGAKVSPVDWAQINLCLNQPSIYFVTEDRKCFLNSMRALGESRTKTVSSLTKELISLFPDNLEIQRVHDFLSQSGKLRFGIKKGEGIRWMKPPIP